MITKDTIVTVLKRCIDSLETIANAQRLGERTVVNKISKSNNQYDYTVYLPANDYTKTFTLTAQTKSGNTSAIKMRYYYTWDNPDVMAGALDHSNMPGRTLMPNYGIPEKGVLRWNFNARNNETPHTLYVKFSFEGTDDVTWTIT